MKEINKIRVVWEFDIELNKELQNLLDITECKVEDMLRNEDDAERLQRLCCSATGVPRYVDLNLFFNDPRAVSVYQITNALSDEYGWFINEWEWVQQS